MYTWESMDGPLRLATARARAIKMMPWLKPALVTLVPSETPGLDTFAVTKEGLLLWDSACTARWSRDQTASVLLHEVSHLVRRHFARAEHHGIDGEMMNICGDLSINCDLDAISLPLPDKPLLPKNHGLPNDLTMEEYYSLIQQKQREQDDQGSGGKGGGKKQKGSGGKKGQQKNQENNGGSQGDTTGEEKGRSEGDPGAASGGRHGVPRKPDKPQVGGGWCGSCAGRRVPGEPPSGTTKEARTPVELDRMRRAVAEEVRNCASKMAGKMPGGWLRWAEIELKPAKVNWLAELQKVLRRAIGNAMGKSDYTWTRPSRRQAGLGYAPGSPILPGMFAPKPEAMILFDMSGSMGKEEVEIGVGEAVALLRALGVPTDFIAFDVPVQARGKVSSARDITKLLHGGGGTSFVAAFAEVKKRKRPPSLVLCVTDGFDTGDLPQTNPLPNTRMVWLLAGAMTRRPYPWGEGIVVDPEGRVARV